VGLLIGKMMRRFLGISVVWLVFLVGGFNCYGGFNMSSMLIIFGKSKYSNNYLIIDF
jgi:hypothetical protein